MKKIITWSIFVILAEFIGLNSNKNMKMQKKGFTLIELLVVMGIIAIIATIVLVAINPARQFAQSRNTQRVSNVHAILNAIGQRTADNKGIFQGTFVAGGVTYTCGPLPDSATVITSNMAADITTKTGDLGCLIPTYLTAMPTDPNPSSGGYTVVASSTVGRTSVAAPSAELGEAIAVTR